MASWVGTGRPGRRQRLGVAVAEDGRHPADGDELAGAAGDDGGEVAQPPVHQRGDVEGAPAERGLDGGGVERIGVDVLDDGGDLVALVAPGVQHRDGEAPIEEPADDVGSGRPGAADDERGGCHRVATLMVDHWLTCPGPWQYARRVTRISTADGVSSG